MRFFTILFLLGSLLLISATGCKSSSIQCQRETALLRAEILDLEDKYYALKSQQRNAIGGTSGGYVTNNVVGSGVIEGAPVVVNSWPVEGQVISGDVIYDDQMIYNDQLIYNDQMVNGAPIVQAPIEGEVYYDGQAYDGQTLPMASPVIGPATQNYPTPAAPAESMDLNIDSPAAEPAIEGNQTLLLPDAPAQEDIPSIEAGFEDLELDLSSDSEVDRVEIVSSATRGKDLDGVAGHDGIELMIQAVNSDGQPVFKTGELTVTVNDNLVGEIGKWTFLPKELELFQSRDELGNMGTLLHLPWTDRIPVSKQVEVRVSMMIGRIQYIATRQIEIKPPTGQANDNAVVGWTASDNRWLSNLRSQPPAQPSTSFQSGSATKAPATAVQRPQWKPVR